MHTSTEAGTKLAKKALQGSALVFLASLIALLTWGAVQVVGWRQGTMTGQVWGPAS